MKKLVALVVLFVFAAGSACFAEEGSSDFASATVELVGDVVAAPVQIITGQDPNDATVEATDPITATVQVAGKTVQDAGNVVDAPINAVTGQKSTD
jgi:hypothetical protein